MCVIIEPGWPCEPKCAHFHSQIQYIQSASQDPRPNINWRLISALGGNQILVKSNEIHQGKRHVHKSGFGWPLEELTKVNPNGRYAGNALDFLQLLPFYVV